MFYREIYDEYKSLMEEKISIQSVLRELKNGYISFKKISGREYAYLQYRNGGKLVCEYIKAKNLQDVCAQLKKRADLSNRLSEIEVRLTKIENASGILDQKLYRQLIILKRCTIMDALCLDDRQRSLSFCNAIAALEGLPASEQTERNLSLWTDGKQSFFDSYQSILRVYNLAEV